ncbi:ThiF family adenylyltransferase [Corallincola holothuriorum]|uniref:ThiF family adenylyltransferase n=1 Tax=Corallincola holothuriorum TaxID=2282215 RepID=A0A368N3R9_9GAMM|nr:ThiF family adenylyltransferase [Corallincola holothuriorum]RCU45128.1 ThiF family adenylyltransferase [Corallincola holothuriorum]
MSEFNYAEAFSRNIGWLTNDEQQRLRHSRIAIAGMGGVGGAHLLTLVRLGCQHFHIADLDQFEQANFNRQAGARLDTLQQQKAATLADMARQINPEVEIRLFEQGVNKDNLEPFLADIDLYMDGLDFFVLPVRRLVFARCRELGIPAVTAAPLGMGAALLSFLPDSMPFDDYFGLNDQSMLEQYLRFYVGLAPKAAHRDYLVLPEKIDLANKKGPSTIMGCEMCAGVAATQALKLLLRRGAVKPAPWSFQYDAYCNRLASSWRPGGYKHPLQRLLLWLARRHLRKQGADI